MTTYSLDLRERVIAAYESTRNKSQVCRQFSIARSTLDRWLQLKEATGALNPRVHRIRGYGHKVNDLDEFRQWLESQLPFERIVDLIPAFEAHYGTGISRSVLTKWVKRSGLTRKKKPSATVKRTPSTE